jgi:hypothetical protein
MHKLLRRLGGYAYYDAGEGGLVIRKSKIQHYKPGFAQAIFGTTSAAAGEGVRLFAAVSMRFITLSLTPAFQREQCVG